MKLSALYDYAAHVHEACGHMNGDPDSEEHRTFLLNALARIHQLRPPEGQAFFIGMFNQSMAHSEEVAYRLKEARRCPSAENNHALRRAILVMHEHVTKLEAIPIAMSASETE
jgi:hypothetical protein